MKRYIIITSLLLLSALILSVFVFYLVLQYQAVTEAAPLGGTPGGDVVQNTEPVMGTIDQNENTVPTSTSQYETIPLRDLELSPVQTSAIEFVGMDVETAEITPAMQACAVSKLDEARVVEIVAGAAPTVSELWQLKSCM